MKIFLSYIRLATIFALVFMLLFVFKGIGLATETPVIYPQLGHSGVISSVKFSPDDKYILSGSHDGTIKLWDVPTRREIRTLLGHSAVTSVAFSPDGRYALSGGWDYSNGQDFSLKLWDLNSGKQIRKYSGHTQYVTSVVFSPDGQSILSGSRDKTLILWNTSKGKIVRILTGHTGDITSIAFSYDGKYILSGSSDKTIKLWSSKTGKLLQTIAGHSRYVSTVAFSPNGKYIASGSGDKTLKIWNISNIKSKISYEYSVDIFASAATFSPDGRTILIVDYLVPALKLLDVNNGDVLRTFNSDEIDFSSKVAFSNDGRYLLSSGSSKIILWDSSNPLALRRFGGDVVAPSLAITQDAKYVFLAGVDTSPLLWDTTSGTVIKTLDRDGTGVILSAAFSIDGRYVFTGRNTSTLLWEVSSGRPVRSFVNSLLEEYDPLSELYNPVALSQDGKYALSGHLNTITLWDIESGKEIHSFADQERKGIIKSLGFSPDGKLIFSGTHDFSSNRNSLKIWDIEKSKEIGAFMSPALDDFFDVNYENFSRTAKWDYSKKLFEISSATAGRPATLTKDGRVAISATSNNSIELWNTYNIKTYKLFEGHTGDITLLNLSPDEQHIISGSKDGTIRKWDIATGKEIAQFISFTDGEWITITPNGYYNASPNGDKHLNVRIGNNVYGIENYREAFFRPDLVKIALSGGSLKEYRNIADVKQPPQVEIVDTPQTVASDELTVKLKLSDTGGGIGDVRLYLNGSAIMLDNSRGLKVVEKNAKQGTNRSYKIRLALGDNNIRAVAFNAENSMQSNHAEQTVTATFTQIAKPTLHALVIGVNEFKNPKLHLQYAVPDADLFTETLMKGASDLFGKVNIVRLTTPKQTTSDNITSELNKMHSINPDDMFILFVASHGTVDDGEYFLLTSNVGSTSTAKLKTDALSQERIKVLIANIPATKKVIVLDTCNAGQMGDAIQVAMLTRGMSEDTAFKILSRAVGSTVLSSATSTQEALEGYKGHGLFTWVLVEGMKGKADKGKTGYIKTIDLVDYVESEVPDIAEKHFQRKQYPTTAVSGQGFPIGKAGL